MKPLTITTGGHNYVITPASVTSELYVALPAISGQTVRFTGMGSDNKIYTASKASVTFTEGKYYNSAIKLTEAPSFSVSDDKQVYFSPGNLQAVCTSADGDASTQETWTWQFAANQWDYIGNVAANNSIDGNGSTSAAGIVDLFGWSSSNTYFGIGGSSAIDYYHDNFADWGRNVIGSYAADTWRTLTTAEWTYLFNTRTVNGGTGEGYSYTLGKSINGKLGIVFYPDNYTGSEYAGSNWSTFEAAGCVFLPAAGYSLNSNNPQKYGTTGCYWSSTEYTAYMYRTEAYRICFYSNTTNLNDTYSKVNRLSVRLVRDAN